MTAGLFHHVDLNVSDMAASRRVYALVLEFLGYRQVKDEPDSCEWDLSPSKATFVGASLGLKLCAPSEAGHRHHRYAPGLHHLAWRADTREQVDALHRLLVAHDIPVLDPPAHYPEYSGDYYAVFLEDPDGIKLELVHATGWI
jgi:glyoxylase I family protein